MSESLDEGTRMRRTPEQSTVSTPKVRVEWDGPTTVDTAVVGRDVQFIGVVLLERDHAVGDLTQLDGTPEIVDRT
jgi:hypothetical protein